MDSTSKNFKANSRRALDDSTLQRALGNIKTGFQEKRRQVTSELPEFEALRDQGRDIKNHVLANLDFYLERFEEKVVENGGVVHWCRTPEEARKTILDIAKTRNAQTVTKGKSMVAEEIGLNDYLEENGIEPVETDLGEYIIQLRHEPPSHIIAPAIHVTREQIAEDFRKHHTDLDPERRLETPQDFTDEARAKLRDRYFAADVGVTGANFLIAETGSTVIVTNEGNGDMTQLLGKCHVVIASLEKIVPTLEDASTILRLLARSATGQEMSVYTTFSTGPRRAKDLDGPEEFHVVLLDNGRSAMLGTEFQDMLRCIRCAACMNHCPVYAAVGGHAYGWVYPGPMGAVLTPSLIGVEEAGHLPNASTFCGRCESVCPMRIPLPKMMRHYRTREFERDLGSPRVKSALKLWAGLATRPKLYRFATGIVMRVLGALGGKAGKFKSLPLAGGWTKVRDMPAPQGKTFHQLYAEKKRVA
ncbi:MAG: LutB/LldF family L-lactate oxidation iron-sulfur protein [Alphaproteobacteria bacterium]|nr:LutB/LldF family L-lactate oxidation iron-sulfur protein [Alphaproteobacteria bacterium]